MFFTNLVLIFIELFDWKGGMCARMCAFNGSPANVSVSVLFIMIFSLKKVWDLLGTDAIFSFFFFQRAHCSNPHFLDEIFISLPNGRNDNMRLDQSE